MVEEGAETKLYMYSHEPPELVDETTAGYTVAFADVISTIYVPDDSEADYEKAPGWSNYADKIQLISDYKGN